ncbi:MAG: HAD-IA family hydrolase, partial [Betaproteobacteria bacterium]
QTGIGDRFAATRCADEGQPKPHPDMLLHLMRTLDVPPAATLMIGDTTHDLLLAANAGVDAVGVGYGAHPMEALRGERSIGLVETVADLRNWLATNA